MWHKAKIQHLEGGAVRAVFPEINIVKNQSVTIRWLFRNTMHPQNLREVWARKNGKLLTFLIYLKTRIREFLIGRMS